MTTKATKRKTNSKGGLNWLAILVHLGALFPLVRFGWEFWQGSFAVIVNPFQEATLRTGEAALILLVLSLACTPLNTFFGWRRALTVRKMLGLYAFFYVSIHFLIFIVDNGYLGNSIKLQLILDATFEKRFALVGFLAFLILLPLAITSTKGWMKRLGRNWKRLHRLTYVAGILAVIHFIWLVKSDIREPLIYAAILGVFLIVRLPQVRKFITAQRTRLRQLRHPKKQQVLTS